MEAVRAIVPYRVDAEGLRRRNAEFVLRWLHDADIPSILVEHSDTPDPALQVPSSVARLRVAADGSAFSKARACNVGARQANAPVLVLIDADTVMAERPLKACISAVARDLDAVRPFGRLEDLSDDRTQTLIGEGSIPEAQALDIDDDRGGERIPLCGGIVVIRSSVYRGVGGMDESFEGWGGEDDALSAALVRSGARTAIAQDPVAFHLFHARDARDRYLHPHYEVNVARARWWHEASDEDVHSAMRAGEERLAEAHRGRGASFG